MDGRERHHNTIHHHPDKLAIEQSGDHWPCRQEQNPPAGHEVNHCPDERDEKVQEEPQRRGLRATLERLGPQQPRSDRLQYLAGAQMELQPNAIKACVISKTPHASPPQKMARKALDDVEVESTRLVPFLLRLTRPIDGRREKSSRVQSQHSSSASICENLRRKLTVRLQQLLRVLPRCLGQLFAA